MTDFLLRTTIRRERRITKEMVETARREAEAKTVTFVRHNGERHVLPHAWATVHLQRLSDTYERQQREIADGTLVPEPTAEGETA